MDLMEDTQMKDKYPQPIPRISKVVGSLQAYIRRPSHGKTRWQFRGIKLMIS
jgi:hypothetical protein